MRLSLVGLGLAGLALLGCGRTTSAPVQIDAIVWFAQASDTLLLRGSGLGIAWTLASPPAAYVNGNTQVLYRLGREPEVFYVEMLHSGEDPVRLFVVFRDRPLNTDTLSDADRQLISSLGGQIRYVYTLTHDVSVAVPALAVRHLATSPLVAEAVPVGPPLHID